MGMMCGGSPPPIQVQRTMPEALKSVMGESSWKTFQYEVTSAIEEPAATLQSKQKLVGIIFTVMIVSFFTGFLSAVPAVIGVQDVTFLFFAPFVVWPPCFILIFCIGCQTSQIMQSLTVALRDVLERQSSANPGVSFHLREEHYVTYGNKRSHTHTVYYIEATFLPGGGSPAASPGSWWGSMGGATNNAVGYTPGYAPVPGSASIASRMATLDDLRRRALISESEYESKRKELLSMV